MTKRKRRLKKPFKQELDMVEHASRLRALPGGSWETVRGLFVWLAVGIILSALGWLALGR
ncbi:hypothetical protein JW933_02885 [candidate division FCPU426 bacterium]|nr:hypothetical protein [candidate division FCPU426 bacterium]